GPAGRSDVSSGRRSAWVAAMVTGFWILVCAGVPLALGVAAILQARDAARRIQCGNNLKQIGLALLNYESTYGTFPPAYIADESGKPMHSWRVLILPQLGEGALYEQYRFDEPWDGPSNRRLLSEMPAIYACRSHAGRNPGTNTAYAAALGERCVF